MTRRRITLHVLGVCAIAALVAGSAPASQVASVSTAAPMVDSVLAVSTDSSGSAASNTCSTTATSAKIGGQRTCLSAGQHCQRPRAAEYGHFGFSCQKSGTQYRLLKKGTSHVVKPHR